MPSDRVFKAQVDPLVREALHDPQRPELIFLSSEIPQGSFTLLSSVLCPLKLSLSIPPYDTPLAPQRQEPLLLCVPVSVSPDDREHLFLHQADSGLNTDSMVCPLCDVGSVT